MPPEIDAAVNAESSTAAEGSSQQETQGTKDAAASPASSTGQAAEQKPAGDGKAESSTATAASPKSSLDAMKQAQSILSTANAERTGQTKAGESPTQEASGKDDAKQEGKTDGAEGSDAAAEAERKFQDSLKPETRARFKKLTDGLASAEPKVKNWDSLQAWVSDSGFKDPKQFAAFLDLGRMSHLEPHKAIPILEHTLETLKKRVGAAGELPADIAERLEKGLIDDATARELAAERGKNKFLDDREVRTRQEADAKQIRDDEKARVDSIASSISVAETAWQKSDPDYGKLAPLVQDKVLALLQQKGNEVRTADDAQKLFKEAVAEVKKVAGTIRGQVREVKGPIGDGGSGKGAAPVPKSSFEAMQLALRATRAGTQ